MAKDRWREICEQYAEDDGLPVREVGAWTIDKLYFWHRYIVITTSAMVGHSKWRAGLAYIDLFAGPGVCKVKRTNQRIPGSTLIAANAPKPFRMILASELDASLAAALRRRLTRTNSATTSLVFEGDCNARIADMVKHVPRRALTLAFIDPEDLRIDFSTVQTLASCGQVDLLILFADRMDIVRNVDLYEKQSESVLDRMLGPGSSWRERWKDLHNRSAENICRFFADEYKAQLRDRLGYRVFGEKIMRSAKGPLYRIIFASKNPKGLEFWETVTRKERGGQMELGF
jgi:three-Cys-motif partner protein